MIQPMLTRPKLILDRTVVSLTSGMFLFFLTLVLIGVNIGPALLQVLAERDSSTVGARRRVFSASLATGTCDEASPVFNLDQALKA